MQVSALDSRPDFIRELLNVFDNNEQAALAQNDYRRGSPTFQSLSIGCFYALALATTMSNWLFGSARGWAVFLYFAIPLPMLASESPRLIHEIDGLHQFPEWALLIVVGIHVGAAIIHLLVYRDRVMQRMWPGEPHSERSLAFSLFALAYLPRLASLPAPRMTASWRHHQRAFRRPETFDGGVCGRRHHQIAPISREMRLTSSCRWRRIA